MVGAAYGILILAPNTGVGHTFLFPSLLLRPDVFCTKLFRKFLPLLLRKYFCLVVFANVLHGCTPSRFRPRYRNGLDVDVRRCLVIVDIKSDDVLRTPTAACPLIGVHSPILDALLQADASVAASDGIVNVLVTECQSREHIMITTYDDANCAVGTIVGIAQRIVLVLVGLEAKFVETLLQPFMKWHRI